MRARRVWALLGLALVLVLLRSILVPGRTLAFRDPIPITAPQTVVLRDSLLDGRLAEWDSTQHAGVPMLANPSTQVLYPPRWVAILASPNVAAANDLFALLNVILALCGGVALGRELGLGRAARMLVGITYALSGSFLSLLTNCPYLAGAAWLPLAFAWLLRARRVGGPQLAGDAPQGSRWRAPAALGLAAAGLAAPLYAGDPQLAGWLALLAACVFLAPLPGVPWRRNLLAFLGLGALTVLLSAAQLLPAAGLVEATTRESMSYEHVSSWSLHPGRLGELFVPYPFGLPYPDQAEYLGGALLEGKISDLWTHTLFLGAAPLLLLLRGLGPLPERFRRARLGLVILVAVSLVLAFGSFLPLHRWLYDYTPYRVFRYPEKHVTLFACAAACLVGLGAEAWLGAPPQRRRLLGWLAVPLVSVVLGGVLHAWARQLAEGDGARSAPSLTGQVAAVVLVQLALLALLALPRLGPRRRGAALVILVALTNLVIGDELSFGGDARYALEPPPSVRAIRQDPEIGLPFPPRVVRLPEGPFGRRPEGPSVGESSLALNVHTLRGASAALYGLDGLHGATGFTPKRVQRYFERPDLELAQRCAVRYVLSPREGVGLDVGLGVSLVRTPGRARLELVSDVDWVPDSEAAWEALAERSADAIVAVGEGPRSAKAKVAGRVALAADADMSAFNRGRVRLVTQATGPALCVVRDAWFVGWSARVDDQPAEIVLVDGAFMGVRVPAGEHRVALDYRTPGLRLGLWLSIPAWLLVIVAVGGALRFGRREARALA